MSYSIRILAGDVELEAKLNDSPTARAIYEALPLETAGSRWGEEIYFEIPVTLEQASDARADMEIGELGYWPPGKAFCIFFGPTPASIGDEPRAASPVNPIGGVTGDVSGLTWVPGGAKVRFEKA